MSQQKNNNIEGPAGITVERAIKIFDAACWNCLYEGMDLFQAKRMFAAMLVAKCVQLGGSRTYACKVLNITPTTISRMIEEPERESIPPGPRLTQALVASAATRKRKKYGTSKD